MRFFLIYIIIIGLFFTACRKVDDFAEQDDILIRNYLQNNQISNYQRDDKSGLYWFYTRLAPTERKIEPFHTVELRYRAQLLDSTIVYDWGQPQRIKLSESIVGWQLGLLYFTRLSAGTLLVPSRLAYGADGLSPNIPANAVIKFELDIVELHPHF